MTQINQSMFSTYILVILILTVTTFVFTNSIHNLSIAYGKVFSKSISHTTAGNNLEESSFVTQLSASGIGFAVPSNMIIREVPTIIQTGTYNHPWLGIAGGALTPDMAQSAGLPLNYKGVIVSSVQRGSPAEKAGLHGINQNSSSNTQKVGDIITGIDGRHLRSIDDLITYIDLHKSIGDNVGLTLNRHGQMMNLNLVLQARP